MKLFKIIFYKTYFYVFYLFKKVHIRILKSANKADFNGSVYNKANDYNSNWYNHEYWLADDYRIEVYQQAIRKYVKSGSVVIDMGTGIGIMAFLASNAGASKVYAIERNEIIETAKIFAKENGFTNITFLKNDSRRVSIPEKADVIIHVQMGHFLFHANMLELISDLRDKYLKKKGKILPNKFRCYIEPVQVKNAWRVPYLWDLKIKSIDFETLKSHRKDKKWGYTYTLIQPSIIDFFLSEPVPFIEFDLEKFQVEDIPLRHHIRRIINKPGRLDGLYLYFEAYFDNELVISTKSENENYARSWIGVLYRVESEELSHLSEIEYDLTIRNLADPESWNFDRIT